VELRSFRTSTFSRPNATNKKAQHTLGFFVWCTRHDSNV
jgi:hypothetical protein